MSYLKEILKEARSSKSLSWETKEGWEKILASPVIRHNMAPRQALAILEVFGEMADNGEDILNALQYVVKCRM